MDRKYSDREVVAISEASSGEFHITDSNIESMREVEETNGDSTFVYIEVIFKDGTVRLYNVSKLIWFSYKN